MSPMLIMALSVGLCGGVAAWLFSVVGTILIWAVFVAWGSYFAVGGDNRAIVLNITSNTFGAVVAWTVALLALSNPIASLPGPVWVGFLVFVSVVFYILASKIPAFSSIPAVSFGYATTFAFITQAPGAFSFDALLSLSFNNAPLIVAVSMAIGTLFATTSVKLTGTLTGLLGKRTAGTLAVNQSEGEAR